MNNIVRAVGIPWYTRDDYPRILEIMVDGHLLPETYEAWQKRANQGKREIEADGGIVIKAMIDPDEFPIWCRRHDLDVNASSRIAFASHHAAEQSRNVS